MQTACTARHLRPFLFAILAMTILASSGGCADFGRHPSWSPFYKNADEDVVGVVSPAERMASLRKLAETAARADAVTKQRAAAEVTHAFQTEADSVTRTEIVRAIGDNPGIGADAVLTAALEDMDNEVRETACSALGKRGDAESVRMLSGTLAGDVDKDVRLAAARALGQTKDPAAVAALGEILNDKDPAMQRRAVESLEKATGKNLGNDVNRWRQYVRGEMPPPAETPSMAERFRRMF